MRIDRKDCRIIATTTSIILVLALMIANAIKTDYTIKIPKKPEVLYDGGNFKIISYNNEKYMINYDIYGGIRKLN